MFEIDTYKVQLVKEGSAEYAHIYADCPENAGEILAQYLKGADREHFVVLMVDCKNHVIGINTVSIGTLCGSLVSPREVFKPAILGNAASIVLGHNHPSGNTEPSKEDIATTKRLVEAGKLMDIPVLDHIIVNVVTGDCTSLKEEGFVR